MRHSLRPFSKWILLSLFFVRLSNHVFRRWTGTRARPPHFANRKRQTRSNGTGSRRPSLASVHSTSSSIRSYSAMRFEKELQQKELRQEMKLRLARLQQQQQLIQNRPHIIISDPHVIATMMPKTVALKTPSPLTPNSLDEFLPCVIETVEVSRNTHRICYAPQKPLALTKTDNFVVISVHFLPEQPTTPVKLSRVIPCTTAAFSDDLFE